jgi:ArsR family transcriptional regulator
MNSTEAIRALAALAQATRLKIFRQLVQAGFGGMAAGKIGEVLHIPQATLSFHLKELAHAGLIAARPQGRFIYYSANYSVMSELMAYLSDHCCNGNPELCIPAAARKSRPQRKTSEKAVR